MSEWGLEKVNRKREAKGRHTNFTAQITSFRSELIGFKSTMIMLKYLICLACLMVVSGCHWGTEFTRHWASSSPDGFLGKKENYCFSTVQLSVNKYEKSEDVNEKLFRLRVFNYQVDDKKKLRTHAIYRGDIIVEAGECSPVFAWDENGVLTVSILAEETREVLKRLALI